MFEFDLGLQIWTLLTFGGLLLLLAKFAFKPLRKILEDRERVILDALEQAKRSNEEAARLAEEHSRHIAEAKEETRLIVERGRQAADEALRKAREQAGAEAKNVVDQARKEIEAEVVRGMDELKGVVATASVRIARQVIGENLDEKRHAVLVDQFIDQLKKEHGQSVPNRKSE